MKSMSFGDRLIDLPVEAAFQQQRASGVGGALGGGGGKPCCSSVLRRSNWSGDRIAAACGVDEGAGGAGGVVEEGLVPLGGGVVDVDGRGGGLDGGEAVVVVDCRAATFFYAATTGIRVV